jgi:NAD(P)-dependent dehydrogenase (short-subunit alcohol dehydrogenase family)
MVRIFYLVILNLNLKKLNMNYFITGVSRGFGKELATHYIESGHNVFGFSLNKLESGNEMSDKLLNSDNFKYYEGSVNNLEDIKNAVEQAINFLGKVDVLINNAGYKVFKLPEDMMNEEYREAINTNLIAPILLCQKFIPEFIKNKKGCIINISSNAGMTFYAEGTAYCSSKAGLISYSLSLSEYLKHKNISVNVISPPTFSTEDYRIDCPEVNHKKLLKSETVIKIIDYIVFNKKFITGRNFPVFKLKTLVKFVILRNLEFLGYLFQFRLK